VAANHYEPPTFVTVTVTPKVVVTELPPVIVRLHEPAATPVTVKVCELVPELGEKLAIPLHVGDPFVTVKLPL
jgi:hypothetical protein